MFRKRNAARQQPEIYYSEPKEGNASFTEWENTYENIGNAPFDRFLVLISFCVWANKSEQTNHHAHADR